MAVILVVDDSPIDRQLIGEHIVRSGATAQFAENGEQALELIAQLRPDCVLTDLQMPELDGLELVKRVRRDFPSIPVILMTGFGSEDIAVEALQAGASSYVSKARLRRDLDEAMRLVLDSAAAVHDRTHVRELLIQSQAEYEFGYQPGAIRALVTYLQNELTQIDFCDDSELIRVGTALTEALTNAIDHGNLELDSRLRELPGDAYRQLGNERSQLAPYCDRKVRVKVTLTPTQATYTVIDQGPGFDIATLPDPTDPENLIRPHGRGVMLMNCFMDEMHFSERGNEVTMIKHRGFKKDDDDEDDERDDD